MTSLRMTSTRCYSEEFLEKTENDEERNGSQINEE